MNWNALTLLALAIFGFLGLLITLLIGFLRQLPELFEAMREARNALRNRSDQ